MKSLSIALVLSFALLLVAQVSIAADDSAGGSTGSIGSTGSGSTGSGSASDLQFAGDLSAMEMKFFEREYPNDSIEHRLDRIDKLVYGTVKSGSVNQRITQLLIDVPHLGDGLPWTDTAPNQTTAATNDKGSDSASNPSDNTDSPPQFSYPMQSRSLISEVTAMEKEVFGKTYSSDSLINRVKRLENTVFSGKSPQTFTPITMRINRLITALQPKFSAPQTVYGNNDSYGNNGNNYPPVAPSYSYSGPSSSENPALSYNYNPAPFKNANSDATTSDTKNSKDKDRKKGHPIWRKFGHVLGEVGEAAAVTAGAMAAGSMMGYGYGGYGFGYPGFGYGMGGFGMGGFGYGYGARPFLGCW